MRREQRAELRIGLGGCELRFEAGRARSAVRRVAASACSSRLAAFLSSLGSVGRGLGVELARRASSASAILQLERRNLLLLRFAIFDQRVDQPIEPAELVDRLGCEGGFVDEMLVAVDDHAELGAPVAEVVVADRVVAEESQHAVEGVADHGRADVADVHRLGHVGRGVVDDDGPRLGGRRDAEPLDVRDWRRRAGR